MAGNNPNISVLDSSATVGIILHQSPLLDQDYWYEETLYRQRVVSLPDRPGSIQTLTEEEDRSILLSNILYSEIMIDSFVSEGKVRLLDPELPIRCYLNPETMVFELFGEGLYEDIFVYGETIVEARDILENEILSLFWEEYVIGRGAKLSPKARRIKADLGKRLQA